MENYLSVIEKNALQAEMTLEEYVLENAGTSLENLKNNYKKIIDESIRQEILIRAIAEREGIAVTEEDTDAYIENTAERLGVSADELRAYYGDDDSFSTYALEDKVLNFLTDATRFISLSEKYENH
jgi:FKBP-type peptidyl-prolyl cis-trans isomerase (trigger factor)